MELWGNEWVTGVITPVSGVITLLITGRGSPCTNLSLLFWHWYPSCGVLYSESSSRCSQIKLQLHSLKKKKVVRIGKQAVIQFTWLWFLRSAMIGSWFSSINHYIPNIGVWGTLPPTIMVQWKLGPSNISFLSFRAVFTLIILGEKVYRYTRLIRSPKPNHLQSTPSAHGPHFDATWPDWNSPQRWSPTFPFN